MPEPAGAITTPRRRDQIAWRRSCSRSRGSAVAGGTRTWPRPRAKANLTPRQPSGQTAGRRSRRAMRTPPDDGPWVAVEAAYGATAASRMSSDSGSADGDVRFRASADRHPGDRPFRRRGQGTCQAANPTFAPSAVIAVTSSWVATFTITIACGFDARVNAMKRPSGDHDPTWSPDGRFIAFTRASMPQVIAIVDVATHEEVGRSRPTARSRVRGLAGALTQTPERSISGVTIG